MQPDQQEVDQTPEPKLLRQPEDLADLRESVQQILGAVDALPRALVS